MSTGRREIIAPIIVVRVPKHFALQAVTEYYGSSRSGGGICRRLGQRLRLRRACI
jgi:hypothetical protein